MKLAFITICLGKTPKVYAGLSSNSVHVYLLTDLAEVVE